MKYGFYKIDDVEVGYESFLVVYPNDTGWFFGFNDECDSLEDKCPWDIFDRGGESLLEDKTYIAPIEMVVW